MGESWPTTKASAAKRAIVPIRVYCAIAMPIPSVATLVMATTPAVREKRANFAIDQVMAVLLY
jgi:hypothetical protein